MNINGLYPLTKPLTQSFSDILNQAGEVAGRAVQMISNLPEYMKNDRNVAIGTFVAANAVFFSVINFVANLAEQKINNRGNEPLTGEQKTITAVLINVGVVGLATGAFNVVLSKLTQYELSKVMIVAIAATMAAFRALVLSRCNAAAENKDNKTPAKDPAKKTQAEDPAKKAKTEDPAKKTPTEEPAKKAKTEDPAKKTPAEDPAKKAKTEDPAKKTPAEDPAKKAKTEDPAKKTPAEEPAKKVAGEEPAQKKADDEGKKPSEEPTEAPVVAIAKQLADEVAKKQAAKKSEEEKTPEAPKAEEKKSEEAAPEAPAPKAEEKKPEEKTPGSPKADDPADKSAAKPEEIKLPDDVLVDDEEEEAADLSGSKSGATPTPAPAAPDAADAAKASEETDDETFMTEEEALQKAAKQSKETILSDAERTDLEDATDEPKGVIKSKSEALDLVKAQQNLALKGLQDVIENEQEDLLEDAIKQYAAAVDQYREVARELLVLKQAIDDAFDEAESKCKETELSNEELEKLASASQAPAAHSFKANNKRLKIAELTTAQQEETKASEALEEIVETKQNNGKLNAASDAYAAAADNCVVCARALLKVQKEIDEKEAAEAAKSPAKGTPGKGTPSGKAKK